MKCAVELAREMSALAARLEVGGYQPEEGMGPMGSVPWERAMKMQDVILRTMGKRITWAAPDIWKGIGGFPSGHRIGYNSKHENCAVTL